MQKFTKINAYLPFIKERLGSDNLSEIIWYFTGQFLVFIFGIIIIKILSQLGKLEYGKYALILTVVSLLGMMIYGPVTQSINRFYYNYQDKHSFKIFYNFINTFIISASAILFFLTFAGFLSIKLFNIKLPYLLVLFAGLFILSHKMNKYANNLLNVVRKRKLNAILQVIEKFLIVASLLIFKHINYFNLEIGLACLASFTFLFGFTKLFIFYNLQKNNVAILKETQTEKKDLIFKNVKRYAAPFILWGLAGWLQLNSEKWIIADFLTTADVGIFAIMMAIVNALIMVPASFLSDFFTPIIFKQFSDATNRTAVATGFRYINLLTVLVSIISAFAILLTLFFGKHLIILISNDEFTIYYKFLPLLALGVGGFYVGQAMSNIGLALNQPIKYLAPKISIGLLSLLFNIVFIKLWGILGIMISVVSIGIIYLSFIYIANQKIMKNIKNVF